MLFANNCNTTLNGGITAIATSMVVTSAIGFPTPTGSQYFYCTLADAATQTTIEIVKVTAVSGTTFTIVRGQDGTSGTIFASGAVVSLRLVAANLNDFPKLDELNTFSQTQTFSASPITSTLTGFVYGNGASAQTVATTAQALSLIGTLPVANGGTGLTTLTAGYIPYGNGTSPFSSSVNLTFNGIDLSVAGKIFSNTTNSTAQINVNGSIGIYNGAGTYSLDTSPTGITIASLGTVNYPSCSGVLIVNNWSIGSVGIFTCGGGGTTLITGSNVGALAYNAGINGYTWTNTAVSAYVYDFMFFRTRTNA